MRRWIDKVAIAGLITAFCLPALGYAWRYGPGDQISETEQRALAPFPSVTNDLRQWTSDIDQHLEDSFGFRMVMIRIARKVRDSLGENPPDVAYGQNDWLFLNDHALIDEFEGNGSWNQSKIDHWVDRLSDLNARLSNNGIPFVAVIAPDKARIYPEMTPERWEESDRRFKSALEAHPRYDQTGLLNIEPRLRSLKEQGHRPYFMRDTHWSPDGYAPVSWDLLAALDPAGERSVSERADRTFWSPDYPLDLDNLLGNIGSREPQYMSIRPKSVVDYRVNRVPAELSVGPVQDEVLTLIVSEGPPDLNDTLVIIGDSFADRLAPELVESYGRVVRVYHGVDRYRIGYDDIMAWEPDAVLFIAVERNVAVMDSPLLPLNDGASEE